MANTPKRLYQGQPGTAETTLYTVPASTSTIVKEIILTNTTTTVAAASISAVPSGGTAGAANRIIAGFSIAANDTKIVPLSTVLNTGDFLSGLQGTASAITVTISGVEMA